MPDPHYPSVDIDFIESRMLATGRLAEDGVVKIGASTTFVLVGIQAIYKRSIMVRELEPGQVCYEQATALASRFKFLGSLMEWLERHRDWKEGAYIVPPERAN